MYDYYNNYYPDYLMHYGVKGMKWGHRKNALSVKAAGHRAMAKVYDINAKTYKKSNKALSSMNAAARTQQLKKADQAQAEANAKREQRNTPEAKAKRKEALKIGAAVAGTALTSYGVYKVSQAIKDKNFKHAMDKGMKVLDANASRGRLDDGMEMLKETMDMHYNAKVSDIVKRNIANNSVNGKVDWKAIRNIYK